MPCFLSVSRHLFLPFPGIILPSPPLLALGPSRRTFLPEPTLRFLAALSPPARPGSRGALDVRALCKVLLAPARTLSSGALQESGARGG